MKKDKKKRSGGGKNVTKGAKGDIDWKKAAYGAPTYDLLDEYDLSKEGDLEKVVDYFIKDLSSEMYVFWEGVIREEQGLTQTKRQREVFDKILMEGDIEFGEEEGEPDIMEMDGFQRPSQPWYETLRKIAEALVVGDDDDDDEEEEGLWEVRRKGWRRLSRAVKKYAGGLSLPSGVKEPMEVVSEEVRKQLSRQARQ